MLPEPPKPWAEMSAYERLEQIQADTYARYQMLRRRIEDYASGHDSKQVDRDLREILAIVDHPAVP